MMELLSLIDPNDLTYLKRKETSKSLHYKDSRRVRLIKKIEQLSLNERQDDKKSYSQNNIIR